MFDHIGRTEGTCCLYVLYALILLFVLFAKFSNQLTLNVARHELVAGKLHDEAGATACKAGERRGVGGHLLEGHFGLKFLVAVLAGHTDNHTATALQVRHYIAHLVSRDENFYIVNGLQYLWTGLTESLTKCIASCQHEGEFVAIYGVHLTVIDDDTHITRITTRQRALLHTRHHALQDSGHKACIDRSTHGTVDKHQFAAPFEVNDFFRLGRHLKLLSTKLIDAGQFHTVEVGLNDEVYLTKLASTTRLFLMTIVGTRCLCDGFAVRYALFVKFDLYLVDIFQTPLQCAQVEFALTMDEDLAQLLRLLHLPCRVFLAHTVECCHHLFRIRLIDGTDGASIFRVGILYPVELVIAVLTVERIARAHILQLDRATDVASLQLFYFIALCTCTNEELLHTFLAAAICIGEVVTFVQRTAHHFEVLHLTDVRLYACLEEIDGKRAIGIGLHLYATSVVDSRHLVHERNNIAQEFHQTANTHVTRCTNTEYGEDATRHHTLADTFTHFIFGEVLGLKEFLHQALIVFGSSLDECTMQFVSFVKFLCGDILDDRFATLGSPREFLHQDNVDECVEAFTSSDRVLHRHDLRTVDGLQLVQDGIIVTVGRVQLVDKEDDRLIEFLGVTEMVLRADLGTEVAIDEEHGSICNVESRERSTYKVITAGAVDEVQLLTFPFRMEYRREYGVAIILLYGEIVTDSILLRDTSAAFDDARVEEEALGEGCLAGAVVTKKCDVLDVVRVIYLHSVNGLSCCK